MVITLCLQHSQALAASERMAQCASCKGTAPSSERARLAFFEDRGEGSEAALRTCLFCHFFECAHDPAYMATLVRQRNGDRRQTVIEDGRCPGPFTPHGAWAYDTYYCGCRGWD